MKYQTYWMDMTNSIENLLKDENGRIIVYSEQNVIVEELLKIFKRDGEVSSLDHVDFLKKSGKLLVQINTPWCSARKCREECVDALTKSTIFAGNWKYIQYSGYYDEIAEIELKDEEAKNGFIRLLKLYSI